MNLTNIERYLRDVSSQYVERNSLAVQEALACYKREAVANNDQDLAKMLWCLEQVLAVQDKYIEAFQQMKAGRFYNAWCTFERVEISLHHLSRHFADTENRYHLRFIDTHVRQYQSLYPYRLFISPEYVVAAKYCTICGQKVSFRCFCGHRPGEIYDGEMCGREIRDIQSFGISLVPNPKQKYSVVFKQGGDHYDYRLLKYLIDRLASPFDAWEVSWTKRLHPHLLFTHLGRNDPCPCESGKKYKNCCLHLEGVMRPHCVFLFSVPPKPSLANIEYVY